MQVSVETTDSTTVDTEIQGAHELLEQAKRLSSASSSMVQLGGDDESGPGVGGAADGRRGRDRKSKWSEEAMQREELLEYGSIDQLREELQVAQTAIDCTALLL